MYKTNKMVKNKKEHMLKTQIIGQVCKSMIDLSLFFVKGGTNGRKTN